MIACIEAAQGQVRRNAQQQVHMAGSDVALHDLDDAHFAHYA